MKALLMLLLPACAQIAYESETSVTDLDVRRAQIRADRYAAGLTREQFEEEIKLLSVRWWRAERIQEGWTFRTPENPRGIEPPPWPNLWPEAKLVVRATLLRNGATERDVLIRVAQDDRLWYEDWLDFTGRFPSLAMGEPPLTSAELPPPPRRPGPTPRYP